MTNKDSMETIIKRSKIIGSLRKNLVGNGYLEVETPTLSSSCGGALAVNNSINTEAFCHIPQRP